MRAVPTLMATLLVAAVTAASARQINPAPIEAAANAPARPAADRARDAARHPVQTLGFFGVQPGMKVVEISPGGGYWTPMLARIVGPTGHLYLAMDGNPAQIAKLKAKLAADPVYANTSITTFGEGKYDIAPPASVDRVLTFRNVHNWMAAGFAPDAFHSFYRALKPGGVLGLEEHRLPEARTTDLDGSKGYVKTSAVVAMAKAAGLVVEHKSEINANSKDKADYPKGVWTLPPTYAEGDKDRARYAAIGESDRMTIAFVKPGI
jgi:predicted methyltransferase